MRLQSSICFVAFFSVSAALAGCGHESPTEPSPGPCTFTLSPTSLSLGPAGGPGSVNVATASGCTWSAASDRGWMSIVNGANGTGNGVVNVSLTPNSAETARTGTLTVAGQNVSVVQEGLGTCSVDISPSSASFSDAPASGTFSVSAASHCAWSATSDSPWLSVTAGNSGTGSETVSYALAGNREATSRTGRISVGQRTFTVQQAGDTRPSVCEYSVTPLSFSPCMSAPYTMSAAITTQQGCTWTASAGTSWISMAGGQSGSGPGVISFTVSDNWDAPRSGVVMVRWPTETAGQNLQVAQAGCYYAVSTSAISIAAAGGNGQFNVVQTSDPISCGSATQDRCRWTAQSDVPWITITTTMPQAGDNPVAFSVAVNSSGAARTGRITVRDKVVQVTQSGQ